MIHTATVKNAALLVASGGAGLLLLVGCSPASSNRAITPAAPPLATLASDAPSSSDVATQVPTLGTSASSPAMGECNKASILQALPAGSTMDKYQCAIASPTLWAAARVKPGPKVFFLQTTSGAWKVSTASQICRTPSASLPKEILAFCPKT